MTGKYTPYIYKVVPAIDNGKEKIKIIIENIKNKRFDQIELSKDIINSDDEFYKLCMKEFNDIFELLKHFKNEFNSDYYWDLDNPCEDGIAKADNGFVSGTINLSNLNNFSFILSNLDDINLASYRSKKYGTLYDYIEFYNDSIKKKLSVKYEELSPLFKTIIDRTYNFDKNMILKK